MSEDTILFLANSDGTVDCAWCEKKFDANLAQPDMNDEPICPECRLQVEEESAGLTRAQYIEDLHYADGDLTPAQLEAEADKFEKWKSSRKLLEEQP